MSIQFLHRMHIPTSYPVKAAELAPDVLKTWKHYSPEAVPAERDFEDWAENAIMLHEAHLASGGSVRLLEANQNIHYHGDMTSYVLSQPGAPLGFMYGMWKPHDSLDFPIDVDMVGNNASVVRAVAGYAKSDIFLKAASRAFHVVDADHDQIEATLLTLHEAGHRQVFVKTRHKESASLPSPRSRQTCGREPSLIPHWSGSSSCTKEPETSSTFRKPSSRPKSIG